MTTSEGMKKKKAIAPVVQLAALRVQNHTIR
jgi:hypothetical protein